MGAIAIEDLGPARAMKRDEIPLIDFGPFRTGTEDARRGVARRIGEACESIGFFYLTNHGIPRSEIDAVFAQSRRFYGQRPEDKARCAATWEWYRGWVPPRKVSESGRRGGLAESFRMMLDLPADDPDVRAGKPLHLPNRYPDALPGFQEVVDRYFADMLGLSRQLAHAFARALDLPETWFDGKFQRPLAQFNLLWYPPLPSDAREDDMSSYPHTDEGMFTLLAQDDVGGLEIRGLDNRWVMAPIVPGAFIVNIGDQLMRWTNDRFVSTPHRVRNRSGRERFSVPFFMNADFDVVVECLPTCVDTGKPPRYEPLHFGQHMVKFWEGGMRYLKDPGAAA